MGRVSRGHPGVVRADIPAQNFGQGPKSWKNKHVGADIHAPKARTSTTLRDFQKLRSEKLWAEFPFPINVRYRSKGVLGEGVGNNKNQVLPEDYCKEDPCNFPWGGELAMS